MELSRYASLFLGNDFDDLDYRFCNFDHDCSMIYHHSTSSLILCITITTAATPSRTSVVTMPATNAFIALTFFLGLLPVAIPCVCFDLIQCLMQEIIIEQHFLDLICTVSVFKQKIHIIFIYTEIAAEHQKIVIIIELF